MKAAVLVEYNKALAIEEVDLRPLGPSDVRIEIDASGVCHSDLNVWQGNVPFLRPPLILGHEGTGRVVEIGRDVWRVSVGDRVITSFVGACGYCWFCVRGDTHLCEEIDPSHTDTKGLLVSGSPVEALNHLGTFAEELVTDEKQVIPVRTDLPSDQLALIGCAITTGVGAVLNTARVEPGSTVTVIGAGGVGQAVVQGARIAGASRIFVVDPVEFKRSAALRHGADRCDRPGRWRPGRSHQKPHGRPWQRLRLRGRRHATDHAAGAQHFTPWRYDGLHRHPEARRDRRPDRLSAPS